MNKTTSGMEMIMKYGFTIGEVLETKNVEISILLADNRALVEALSNLMPIDDNDNALCKAYAAEFEQARAALNKARHD